MRTPAEIIAEIRSLVPTTEEERRRFVMPDETVARLTRERFEAEVFIVTPIFTATAYWCAAGWPIASGADRELVEQAAQIYCRELWPEKYHEGFHIHGRGVEGYVIEESFQLTRPPV